MAMRIQQPANHDRPHGPSSLLDKPPCLRVSPPVAVRREMMFDFENDLPPVLNQNRRPFRRHPARRCWRGLLNVLAIPVGVFEEVRDTRHSVWNWLVPVPLYAISPRCSP